MILKVNSNSLVVKQKQKQTYKQKGIYKEWVLKLNCKIEFFVRYNGHQNCLDKFLLSHSIRVPSILLFPL